MAMLMVAVPVNGKRDIKFWQHANDLSLRNTIF